MIITTIYIWHAENLYIQFAIQKSGHLDANIPVMLKWLSEPYAATYFLASF